MSREGREEEKVQCLGARDFLKQRERPNAVTAVRSRAVAEGSGTTVMSNRVTNPKVSAVPLVAKVEAAKTRDTESPNVA